MLQQRLRAEPQEVQPGKLQILRLEQQGKHPRQPLVQRVKLPFQLLALLAKHLCKQLEPQAKLPVRVVQQELLEAQALQRQVQHLNHLNPLAQQ